MKFALLSIFLLAAPSAFAEKVPARGSAPSQAPSGKASAPGAAAARAADKPQEKPAEPVMLPPAPDAENYNYFHMMATDTLRDSVAAPEIEKPAKPAVPPQKTPKK